VTPRVETSPVRWLFPGWTRLSHLRPFTESYPWGVACRRTIG
jgi:hypothetical protein